MHLHLRSSAKRTTMMAVNRLSSSLHVFLHMLATDTQELHAACAASTSANLSFGGLLGFLHQN